MAEVRGVFAQDLDAWWPQIADWVDAALAAGGDLYGPDDVRAGIERRDYQLWLLFDPGLSGFALTQIVTYPRATALVVQLCGGVGVDGWLSDLVGLLERFGAAKGCERLICEGRRGWVKKLGALGWSPRTTVFVKELG